LRDVRQVGDLELEVVGHVADQELVLRPNHVVVTARGRSGDNEGKRQHAERRSLKAMG
jgi:hypothetical protein